MTNKIDFTTLTDEELSAFYKAWENEAKRRRAIRKRQALMNLRDALGKFIAEGVYYDCEKYAELEVVNGRGEDDTVEVDIFNEWVLTNMKDFLDEKVGNYTGE